MKEYFLLLSLGVVNVHAAAISINPINGEKEIRVEERYSFIGSCGASVVRVSGFELGENSDYLRKDSDISVIAVTNGRAELLIKKELSDFVTVKCVKSISKGHRLVVSTNCSGSLCGDNYTHYIVDMLTIKMLTPKGVENEYLSSYLEK